MSVHSEENLKRGTLEIEWGDVAGIFQRVEAKKAKTAEKAPVPIYAPFCRAAPTDLSDDDDESDTEEDLSEETVLGRHQLVLDDMKAKLTAYLEARKQSSSARKGRK